MGTRCTLQSACCPCLVACVQVLTIHDVGASTYYFLAADLQILNELTGKLGGIVGAEAPVLNTSPVHLAPAYICTQEHTCLCQLVTAASIISTWTCKIPRQGDLGITHCITSLRLSIVSATLRLRFYKERCS